MSSKKQRKVSGLLKRYPFIDFSRAITVPLSRRKEHLRNFLERDAKGRWKSYKGFRALIPDTVGVEMPLDPGIRSKKDVLETLERERVCHPDDLAMNRDAISCLFDFIRPMGLNCYDDHPRNNLEIGPDRFIQIPIMHYAVQEGRGAFQFVYPRRNPLKADVIKFCLSLVHHNYVRGDFSELNVEMVLLSCDEVLGPRGGSSLSQNRQPRIISLPREEIVDQSLLNHEAQETYRLLLEIADESD